MGEDLSGKPIGERLYEAGWKRGVILRHSPIVPLTCVWNGTDPNTGEVTRGQRVLRPRERLIVASQDCDIVASEDAEPFVEALICTVERRAEILARKSARWFVVDPTTGLTAQAKYRFSIAKPSLEQFAPEPWPSDTKRLERFGRWLAHRYDRPAIPTAFVEAFVQPIHRILGEIEEGQPVVSRALSGLIRDIRMSIPSTERPPFDLDLILMVDSAEVTAEQADALDYAERAIRSGLDQSLVRLGSIDVRTEEQMSVAEYFQTWPLYLDYLTYHGHEILGLEPFPTA